MAKGKFVTGKTKLVEVGRDLDQKSLTLDQLMCLEELASCAEAYLVKGF